MKPHYPPTTPRTPGALAETNNSDDTATSLQPEDRKEDKTQKKGSDTPSQQRPDPLPPSPEWPSCHLPPSPGKKCCLEGKTRKGTSPDSM